MLKQLLIRLVGFCCRHAAAVAGTALLLTLLLGAFAAHNLGMHTDTDRLFPEELDWRQREIEFDRAFPHNDNLLAVVIDARSPAGAERAAAQLEQKLIARPELFHSVAQPGGGGFFRRHGLLYLDEEELRELSTQVAEVQPFLGTLAADPSLGSLFGVLADAVEAAANGDIGADRIVKPLAAVAASLESVLAGGSEPLSWRMLVTGRQPAADELRRFLLVQPALDYGSLSAGADAASYIRAAAAELGLTPEHGVRVRLTGSVALSDEEFATVAEGTGLAAVVSFTLVSMLLLLAVRSLRLVLCMLGTLIAGVVATCAFAAAAVGAINIISIAFVVLFIGIAVDFSIQFSVRWLDEHARAPDLAGALRITAGTTGVSLVLAASACAVGFLSLIPTEYKGMAELGIISGAGMLIALLLNLTLLPALIVLLRPRHGLTHAGFSWAAPLDRLVLERRRAILAGAAVLALAGMLAARGLEFDFDPLHLKDPDSESVSTLYDLMGSPNATPFTISVLEPDVASAAALAERLEALPEVDKVLTLASFVPQDQETRLAIVDELALLTGPMSVAEPAADAGSAARTLEQLGAVRARLAAAQVDPALADTVTRLQNALGELLTRDPVPLAALEQALLSDLPFELESLDLALQAAPVSLATLPEDLRRDWVAADGRARVEVFARGDIRATAVRERFAAAVTRVAPHAGGAVVTSIESGRTIVQAFITAGIIALAAITALLGVVLRRAGDVLRVLAPLLLGALLTLLVCVAAGLPLNFANIIALPLILGIGVSFAIYFVINWRNGMSAPLQSATARAVLFSALLTGTAFGSLMLSTHPGTASMGELLGIALGCTLICTWFMLPALLGPPPQRG